MTSDEIFEIRDLYYLYRLWNSKTISEPERMDVATMIDRIEKHNKQIENENFDIAEQLAIKNKKYSDILYD